MRQADTTQETPGGNRGIAVALVRRLREDAASALLRGGSLPTRRQRYYLSARFHSRLAWAGGTRNADTTAGSPRWKPGDRDCVDAASA